VAKAALGAGLGPMYLEQQMEKWLKIRDEAVLGELRR
jgi:hypothetical protein